jgi:hypothetical protein
MKDGCRGWRPTVHGLWLCLWVGLSGCGPAFLEEPEAWASREAPIRIPNSLSTQALVFNALSTNKIANQLLGTNALGPLFSSPGHPTILNQLQDPAARQFMNYLVSCALAKGQDLQWTDPSTGSVRTWPGQLGICPAWKSQAPTQACLQQVSSCLLARNNAFGMRVELSLRGEHPTSTSVFTLEPATPPSEYVPLTPQRLASFETCSLSAGSGASRDCGWKGDAVGACQPGTPVVLGAGGLDPDTCTGTALGSSSGTRMVLRVCEGIHGCDHGGTLPWLGESEGSCATVAPAVAFTCPAAGHFSVMTAPYTPGQSGTATVQLAPSSAQYRLPESAVFHLREGAFYGTVFDPEALAAEVFVRDGKVILPEEPVKGSVYRRMYSCYDSGWEAGAANATYRVCALPNSGANCAAQVTGMCVNPSDRTYPASMCATDDGSKVSGDGDYEKCRDHQSSTVWNYPVTSFIHSACDVLGDYGKPELCTRPRTSPKLP